MKGTVLIRFKDYLIAVLLLCSQHYSATQATEKPIQTIEDFRAAAFNEGYDARLSILRSKKQTSSWIKEIDGKFTNSIEHEIKDLLCNAYLKKGEFQNDRDDIFEFSVTRDGTILYDQYTPENWNALVIYNAVWFMLGYGGDKFSDYIKSRLSLDFELQDTDLKEKLDEQDAKMDRLLESLSNYNILDRQNDITLREIKSNIDKIEQKK